MPRSNSAKAAGAFRDCQLGAKAADRQNELADSPRAMRGIAGNPGVVGALDRIAVADCIASQFPADTRALPVC